MADTKIEANNDTAFVLEQNQRLSQSLLWQFQRTYFENQGIEAWRQGAVPHYVTSNPFIADAYARVVLAFFRDWHAAADANNPMPLDPGRPVYIIELGAGPGRFAFHFLKQFLSLLGRSELRDLSFKYIMTDLAQANIDFWRGHPSLQSFIGQGLLDFARFDASQCQAIELLHSNEVLSRQTIKNPVVVVANYFFDAIPQDVFYLHGGQLHEGRVTITSPQSESDLSDPEILSRIQVGYKHQPVTPERYDDAAFNQILKDYGQRLGETTILFPIAALECIRFLIQLSSSRLLLLSGDKGFHWEEDLIGWDEPEMVIHGGCFSMPLNFHALGQYVLNHGGQVLQTPHHHPSLDIAAFLLGPPSNGFREIDRVFEQTIEKFSPDDLFKLLYSIENSYDAMTPDQILAWLKLSRWDPNLLLSFFPTLMSHLHSVSREFKEELIWVIEHVWDNYYDIGEGQNLAFYLGTLLCAMEIYPEALKYLEYSLQHFGPDARTYYNMSLCLDALQQKDTALEHARQALATDPTFEPAKALIVTIESKLSRQARRANRTW